MRLEFDSSVPILDQRMRVANSKQPGRKHQKRKGSRCLEREKATAKRNCKLIVIKMRKHKNEVSDYWKGIRDTYHCL